MLIDEKESFIPKAYAIIPARYASTRFPAKALAEIGGKPLFWHAYKRAIDSGLFAGVYLATDDIRIEEKAQELEVLFVRTKSEHITGTDRVREAVQILDLPNDAIIANIQGDEPFLTKEMFQVLLEPFFLNLESDSERKDEKLWNQNSLETSCKCSTLGVILDVKKQFERILSPNQVKIVMAKNGEALYFSRLPIPYFRDNPLKIKSDTEQSFEENSIVNPHSYIGHVGIYAFTREILERMANFAPSPLEEMEKLEQLRLLENNIKIRVGIIKNAPHGVDTVEDLDRAREYYESHQEFWV